MQQEIFDARLQHYLRRMLNKLDDEKKAQLKSIRLCNQSIMYQPNVQPAVFLLRNNRGDGEAKFFGQMTCKNPWACPHCSSIRMAKYREEICSALDMFRERGLFGFMVTFTIPHLRWQSCREVTDILYNTYRECFRNAWKKNRFNKDGSVRYHSKFNRFIYDNDIQSFVRCAEYTWGKKNGWHPHFHCIFWLPREKAKSFDVEKWEKFINDAWAVELERNVVRYWQEKDLYAEANLQTKAKTLLMYLREVNKNYERPAIKISVDKDGKLSESLTSDYLSGWGADRELTGNYKKMASHEEHLTPYQILEKAADGDKLMEELYIEYCLQVTRKPVHHRVDMQKGLRKQLAAWRNTEGYKKIIKKKSAEKPVWELVCWFSKEQWFSLCSNKDSPILSNIMYLAAINRKDLLIEFLQAFDIYLLPYEHFFQQHVVNIFNGVAKAA